MKQLILTALLLASLQQFAAAAEPLADFKVIVEECKASFAAKPPTKVAFNPTTSSWTKQASLPAVITFDVRKTDSLVRPYSAFIEVLETRTAEKASDEQAANSLVVNVEDAASAVRNTSRIDFLFEEGKWTIQGGSYTTSVRIRGEKKFDLSRSISSTPEKIRAWSGEIASCVGK